MTYNRLLLQASLDVVAREVVNENLPDARLPFLPRYRLAHPGLTRADVLSDTSKARKVYQDFFALWKDADTGIPILQQARQEYEKMK